MAVTLVGIQKKFIGLSTDVKPSIGCQMDGRILTALELPAGSTFFAADTCVMYRWDGQAWKAPPVNEELMQALLGAVEALRLEVIALRVGMIDAGNCKEVNPQDLPSESLSGSVTT